jgi:hypothetical protein
MDKKLMDQPPKSDAQNVQASDISDLPRAQWLETIEHIGEDVGYFEPLGADHCVMFSDEAPRLLVTFESFDSITERSENGLPLGYNFAKKHGWSHLSIIAHGNDPTSLWFRVHNIYGYFDRLVDEGFFEDFDQVVFYGAGHSGYAACAYSVASPGATVIAIAPQATLDARLASWDKRFPNMRRMDFSTRYGFAPHMIDAADHAMILYDPHIDPDAMHAALFKNCHTSLRPVRNFGADPEFEMLEMGAIEPLLIAAMNGVLTQRVVTQALRNRRHHAGYQRRLLTEVTAQNHPLLTTLLCAHVLKTRKARPFESALDVAQKSMQEQGMTIPFDVKSN